MTSALTYVSHSHLCNPIQGLSRITKLSLILKSSWRVKIIRAIIYVLSFSRYRKWCKSSSAVLACIGIGLEKRKAPPCIHLYPVCTRGSFVILDYPWCNLIFLGINGIHHFLVGFKWNWSHWVYCAQPSPSWLSVQFPSWRSFPTICPKRVLGY